MNWLSQLFIGRTSRRDYLLYWLLPSTIVTAATALMPSQVGWVDLLLSAMMVVLPPLDLLFGVRRFHDTGLSGWWYIVLGFPLHVRAPVLILASIAWYSFPLLQSENSRSWLGPAVMIALLAIALAAFSWVIYRLCIRAGDIGPNRFGDDPIGGSPAAGLA